MGINSWWIADPDQRVWMEITASKNFGEQLSAPQSGGRDSLQWSYSLVALVQPGDIVLHYPTQGPDRGSVVGWSIAAGPAHTVSDFAWQARGTSGRKRGKATIGPGWVVPLKNFTRLRPTLSNATLQDSLGTLMKLKDELVQVHGKRIYFPWMQYRNDELRGQQGYLTKFPVEVLPLFDELQPIRTLFTDDPGNNRAGGRSVMTWDAPKGGVRRIQDPLVRAAIERHALDVAAEYYAGIGGTDLIELGKPYDLRVTVQSIDRHAEVKGSSMTVDAVELTKNEVHHAHEYVDTDLIVVDRIQWTRLKSGAIKTEGGRRRVWRNWVPAAESLTPLTFSHALPAPSTDKYPASDDDQTHARHA